MIPPSCQDAVNENKMNKQKKTIPEICILKSDIKKNFTASYIYKLLMKSEQPMYYSRVILENF